MEKLASKATQGPVRVVEDIATWPLVRQDWGDARNILKTDCSMSSWSWEQDIDVAKANAALAAEAFNVTHESGMTPAEMWKRLQYVEGLMDKFERQEISFAKKCDDILTRISQMPLGKRIDEGLDDAVLRNIGERQDLLVAAVDVLTHEGETEWADSQRSSAHSAALRNLREVLASMGRPPIHPPLDCDRDVLVAYLKGLQEGERVIEAGQSGMMGRKGKVYIGRNKEEPCVCVLWDVLPGEEGQMGTSATGGTRRLKDAGVTETTT